MDEQLFRLSAIGAGRLVDVHRSNVELHVQLLAWEANKLCQSEIEKRFLVSFQVVTIEQVIDHAPESACQLRICSHQTSGPRGSQLIPIDAVHEPTYFASQFRELGRELDILETYDFMWLQPQIGPYRADFVICRAAYGVDMKLDWPELVEVSLPVVVECDGHDFHERTKEQARHDRQRDRFMQSQGFRVMRFTGSELHSDPFTCALEVDAMLKSTQARAKDFKLALLG